MGRTKSNPSTTTRSKPKHARSPSPPSSPSPSSSPSRKKRASSFTKDKDKKLKAPSSDKVRDAHEKKKGETVVTRQEQVKRKGKEAQEESSCEEERTKDEKRKPASKGARKEVSPSSSSEESGSELEGEAEDDDPDPNSDDSSDADEPLGRLSERPFPSTSHKRKYKDDKGRKQEEDEEDEENEEDIHDPLKEIKQRLASDKKLNSKERAKLLKSLETPQRSPVGKPRGIAAKEKKRVRVKVEKSEKGTRMAEKTEGEEDEDEEGEGSNDESGDEQQENDSMDLDEAFQDSQKDKKVKREKLKAEMQIRANSLYLTRSEEIIDNYAAPYKERYEQAVLTLRSSSDQAIERLETQLRAYDGREMSKHMQAWNQAQVDTALNMMKRLDELDAHISKHTAKVRELFATIDTCDDTKERLAKEARAKCEELFTRQFAQVEQTKTLIEETKATYREKWDVANDPERQTNETNMYLAQAFAGGLPGSSTAGSETGGGRGARGARGTRGARGARGGRGGRGTSSASRARR